MDRVKPGPWPRSWGGEQRPGSGRQTGGCEDPPGPSGRECSPFLSSLARGQIEWSQLVTVPHHKLQAPVQPCDCFSGTEQCWAQCCEAARLSSGGGEWVSTLSGPLRFGVLNYSLTREKAQESCGAGGLTADRLRAGIRRKPGTQEERLLVCEGYLNRGGCPVPSLGMREQGVTVPLPPPPTGMVRLQRAAQLPQWSGELFTPNPIPLLRAGAFLLGQV